MTKTELYWVAGLLEGEGCFSRKSSGGTSRNILVSCQMTDPDVLKRLQRIAGGTFHGPHGNGPRGRLPRYMWRVHGKAARLLMEKLLPLMGKRRSGRIRLLIREYDAVVDHVFRLLHIDSGRIVETTALRPLLRKLKLNETNLWRTLSGERRQYRGWRRLQ